ncbi:hypothetical protein [Polaromonas sp.]|uniref:hypothetical protein n=1 Tax=Polaromonas sp. TaxID=1869339 RepID=UPI003263431B
MTDILAWFNLGRWLMLLALAGALTLGYFAWADHQQDIGYGKARAEYAKQAKDVDDKRAAVAPPIVAKQEAAQAKIRTVTETIIKEVPIYVKADTCPMSGGFRVLHDAAANGEVPNPAAIPDAAPVPAQTAASTVAENYGTCRAAIENLSGLREWVRVQEALK